MWCVLPKSITKHTDDERLRYRAFIMVTENQRRDYDKYFIKEGDATFSPERNALIMDESIKAYEAKRKLQHNKFVEQLKERVDATVSLLFSTKGVCQRCPADSTEPCPHNTIEKYFGRKYLAHLQGQRILQKMSRLRDGKQVITLDEVA